jgi:hypothetical protein
MAHNHVRSPPRQNPEVAAREHLPVARMGGPI